MPSKYAEDIATIEERTQNIHRTLKRIEEKIDRINHTVDGHDVEIAKLNTKQGIWAASQGGFTVIAAAIAAWLGVNR